MKRLPSPRIAVIVPCFNEELTIGEVVRDFKNTLPEAEVIVVDNCSTDRTGDVAEASGAMVMREHAQGKGSVMQIAFEKIEADVYVTVDGDATYSASDIRKILDPILKGRADMVVGNRLNAANSEVWHQHRVLGNKMICSFFNLLYGTNFSDILSGYRALSFDAARKMKFASKGFEIETEITAKAVKNKLRVEEPPVIYRKRPEGSRSKLSALKDGFKIMGLMIKLRMK